MEEGNSMTSETPEVKVLDSKSLESGDLLRKVGILAAEGSRFVTATCVDTGAGFEVLYHFERDGRLEHLRVTVAKGASVPSLGEIYPGATFLENEIRISLAST
jgi:NADH:ubiquinone oxidoreductase subunit C